MSRRGRLGEPDRHCGAIVIPHLVYLPLSMLTVKTAIGAVWVKRRFLDLVHRLQYPLPCIDDGDPEPGPVEYRHRLPGADPGERVERHVDAEADGIARVGRTQHGQIQ